MLLEHGLGLHREAVKVERAVSRVLVRGVRTQDLRSRARETGRDKVRFVSTREMGELVCDLLRMPDAM